MAYQNVGTPRFYINRLEWLKENNALVIHEEPSGLRYWHDVFRTFPLSPTINMSDILSGQLGTNADSHTILSGGEDGYSTANQFLILLGIDFGSQIKLSDSGGYDPAAVEEVIINAQVDPVILPDPHYAGFSIVHLESDKAFVIENSQVEGTFGSIIFGDFFDMPHSPDLSLTMTREYGGIKNIETKGGASLSNSFYKKPTAWGHLGAWELYPQGQDEVIPPIFKNSSSSGRRVWDLSFSYLQDSDVFPATSNLLTDTAVIASDIESAGYTLDTETSASGESWQENRYFTYHDDFYAQVIHKTNGGQLPFIFQPDGNNALPDQFAICKFDMNSFKFEQVAHGVYNISLKIREVW